MSRFERVRRLYTTVALHFLNAALLLLALHGALWLLFRVKDQRASATRPTLLEPAALRRVARAHGERSLEDIAELVRVNERLYYQYEPFTEYRMRPITSRLVHFSEHGFRQGEEVAPWPPPAGTPSVFFFGGSTAMGALAADSETISAYLQRELRKRPGLERCLVYNFGRSSYFSQQERALLEQLLMAGRAPSAAVFLDGLNDFFHWDGIPNCTPLLRHVFPFNLAEDLPSPGWREALVQTPFGRAAAALRRTSARGRPTPPDPIEMKGTPAVGHPPPDDPAVADAVVRRWILNRACTAAVCARFHVRPLFVWQPVPTYGFDLRRHALYPGRFEYFRGHQRSRTGYAHMARRWSALPDQEELLWLAALHNQVPGDLYVDAVHYSPRFSRAIAARIAQVLLTRGMLTPTSRARRGTENHSRSRSAGSPTGGALGLRADGGQE